MGSSSPPNLYGGPRSVNASALRVLANAAAGEIEPLKTSQPVIRYERTRRFIRTATTNFAVYGTVQGIQRFFPGAWVDPRFTIQLVFGIPQTVRAVRHGRMNIALAAPAVTIAWFITFTALSGIMQTVLITSSSSYFGQVSRAVGNVVDKTIRGSANSSTLKYKIAQVIGHFVYAYKMYRGTAPVLQGPNGFSRAFAADMTGTMGRGLGHALKAAGRAAIRHPLEATVATTIAALGLVPQKKNALVKSGASPKKRTSRSRS